MTTTARELVNAVDALPDPDREAVIAELLLRRPPGAGDLPDAAFEELAADVFRIYDDAEAADAARPR